MRRMQICRRCRATGLREPSSHNTYLHCACYRANIASHQPWFRCSEKRAHMHDWHICAHTLAQNCPCEFCSGTHILRAKTLPLYTPDRNGSGKRPEKVWRSYHRHSWCSWSQIVKKNGGINLRLGQPCMTSKSDKMVLVLAAAHHRNLTWKWK